MGGKTKIKNMIVEPKAPNGLKVGDLIYEKYLPSRANGTDFYFRIYVLTKRAVLDGETWFRAKRVYPLGVDLKEDDSDIIIGGVLKYKILNI
jgi:hypothetical protein